jgi:hypothetical protein
MQVLGWAEGTDYSAAVLTTMLLVRCSLILDFRRFIQKSESQTKLITLHPKVFSNYRIFRLRKKVKDDKLQQATQLSMYEITVFFLFQHFHEYLGHLVCKY